TFSNGYTSTRQHSLRLFPGPIQEPESIRWSPSFSLLGRFWKTAQLHCSEIPAADPRPSDRRFPCCPAGRGFPRLTTCCSRDRVAPLGLMRLFFWIRVN